MRYFRDIGLLILYSLLALFFIDADSIFICALLCTVILLCCCYIFENHVIAALLFLTYGLAVLVLPDFLLFYPVFIYVILYSHLQLFLLWAAGIFLFRSPSMKEFPDVLVCAIFFGVLLSVFLEKSTSEYEKLELDFLHCRDDSEERTLLLAEKIHALLEKQNYEIYNATLNERNRIARESMIM